MKTSEWALPFTYERAGQHAEWLAGRTAYTNRQFLARAYDAVRPGWDGLATALPRLPTGARPPENFVQGTLVDDFPVYLRDLLRQGG